MTPVPADRDYPQMAAEVNRVEPAPRRVRGYLGGELIFDTARARYVWELPFYPQYYIPVEDVDARFLADGTRPLVVACGMLSVQPRSTDGAQAIGSSTSATENRPTPATAAHPIPARRDRNSRPAHSAPAMMIAEQASSSLLNSTRYG